MQDLLNLLQSFNTEEVRSQLKGPINGLLDIVVLFLREFRNHPDAMYEIAQMHRAFYDKLVNAGFTESQAIDLMAATFSRFQKR